MREMSGRERAIRTMNFEPVDRLPIMANMLPPWFVQQVTGIPEEEYWRDQLSAHIRSMHVLGMDFHIQNWYPVRKETERDWSRGELAHWNDPDNVVADIELRIAEMARRWQDLAADAGARETRIQEICAHQLDMQNRLTERVFWPFGMDQYGPHPLSFGYETYGYEGYFQACALYPDVLDRYWSAAACLAGWHNACVVEAACRLDWPRIGYLGEDMTDQRGNMVSPRFMARCFFPHLDTALAPLVQAGFKLVWHSDGNMNALLRPLIDVGIAGFQGFQEECGTRIADVAHLRARNGDPLLLWGSVSVINVVGPGTPDDIRREVQRVLDDWPHPGLCLGTASYVPPDTRAENIHALYDWMRTLGAGVHRGS
jgi:Uroporphyrinogen decarboxylase (URO-D)